MHGWALTSLPQRLSWLWHVSPQQTISKSIVPIPICQRSLSQRFMLLFQDALNNVLIKLWWLVCGENARGKAFTVHAFSLSSIHDFFFFYCHHCYIWTIWSGKGHLSWSYWGEQLPGLLNQWPLWQVTAMISGCIPAGLNLVTASSSSEIIQFKENRTAINKGNTMHSFSNG